MGQFCIKKLDLQISLIPVQYQFKFIIIHFTIHVRYATSHDSGGTLVALVCQYQGISRRTHPSLVPIDHRKLPYAHNNPMMIIRPLHLSPPNYIVAHVIQPVSCASLKIQQKCWDLISLAWTLSSTVSYSFVLQYTKCIQALNIREKFRC